MAGDHRGAADLAVRGRCASLPAMPTQPAIAVCAPIRQLWPIWIWLSSLTSSSITVSSIAPRSIVVLAPISTSAPMHDAPDLRDLEPAAVLLGHAEAVGADAPRRDARCARGPMTQRVVQRDARRAAPRRRRSTHVAPITQPRADRGRARRCARRRRRPRAGRSTRVAATLRRAIDDAPTDARPASAARRGCRSAATLREGRVRIGGRRASAARVAAASPARRSRRARASTRAARR